MNPVIPTDEVALATEERRDLLSLSTRENPTVILRD
jgi:hypothetical protein